MSEITCTPSIAVTIGGQERVYHAFVTTAAPTVNTSPKEFAPVMQGGLQWPKWGLYIESHGKQGEACDTEEGKKLLASRLAGARQ